MTSLSLEDLAAMLQRAGLSVPAEELERICPAAEDYLRRARELSIEIHGDAEVGGVFRAGSAQP